MIPQDAPHPLAGGEGESETAKLTESNISQKADDVKGGLVKDALDELLGAEEPPKVIQADETLDAAIEAIPFPLDALHPQVADIVRQVTDCYQLPSVEMPAVASLAAVAGAIGKCAYTVGAVRGHKTYCNLYVAMGAPSGIGKSSCGKIIQPILDKQKAMIEQWAEHDRDVMKADYDAAVERYNSLKKPKGGKEKGSSAHSATDSRAEMAQLAGDIRRWEFLLKRSPALTCGDTTGAALAEIIERNGEQIFSYSPDAGGLISVALGKYSKGQESDFELQLCGFTVEPYQESRAGRGDKQLVPCISALWLVQPQVLRNLLGHAAAHDRGLLARFVFGETSWNGEVPHDDGQNREIEDGVYERWASILNNLLRLREVAPIVIYCDEEAKEVFRSIHNEGVDLRNELTQHYDSALARRRELSIRVAGGLALVDMVVSGNKPRINGETAERAKRIIEWAQRSTLRMLSTGMESRISERLDKLMGILNSKSGQPVTLRDLEGRNGFSKKEVKHLVESSGLLEIVEVSNPKGGRPSATLCFKGVSQVSQVSQAGT